MDMWNLADIFTNVCFVGWIFLRMAAWVIVKREESVGINPYYPRHGNSEFEDLRLYNSRKYPLRGNILGMQTHSTAWY